MTGATGRFPYRELAFVQRSSQQVWFLVVAWIVINLIVFIGPLFVFVGSLYQVRERAIVVGQLSAQMPGHFSVQLDTWFFRSLHYAF